MRFLLVLLCAFSLTSFGKTFRSKFVTLDLPPNWDCQQEELDWVCQPENPNLRHEAILVIVTKAVDPKDDTLDKYKSYLKDPKKMRDLLGNSYTSEVKYVREKKIRDHVWVDSLQIGAEVPGFFSRYLASTKDQIAAMISYHVAESVFPKWAEILDKMIDSAELRFDPKAFDEIMRNRNTSLFGNRAKQGLTPATGSQKQVTPNGESDNGNLFVTLAGVALIASCIGFIIYRRKKKLGS